MISILSVIAYVPEVILTMKCCFMYAVCSFFSSETDVQKSSIIMKSGS